MPWPWAEETGSGSPRPSSWNSASSGESAMPSALLTASSTFLPALRRYLAISWSCPETPWRTSVTKITASASATAWRVCLAISRTMPVGCSGSKPPVSTTMNSCPPTVASP
jgi:hypothetical protein